MHLYLQIDGFFSPPSHARTLAGLGSSRHALIRALAGSSKDTDRSDRWFTGGFHCFGVSKRRLFVPYIEDEKINEHLSQKLVVWLLVMEISITRSTEFLWVHRVLSFVWPSPGRRCETGIRESSVLFLFFK